MSSPKVFISYPHDDSAWVLAFAEALRDQQIEVWLDQWQIEVGDSIREAIEYGLRSSDAIVTVLSRANARNPNVFFEVGVALGMGKLLIPIVGSDLEVSAIPFDLRTRRYLTRGEPKDAAREVATAVRSRARSGEHEDA